MRAATKYIKYILRGAGGCTVVAICAGLPLYELYLAWARHVIASPLRRGHYVTTLDGQPIEFWISVAVYVAVLIMLSLVISFVVYLASGKTTHFRAGPPPPLDDAIRQPFDER